MLATSLRILRLLVPRAHRACGIFLSSASGAVTVIFAVLGGIMIACMCMAVSIIDYVMTQARVQAALDAATLSSGANLAHYDCANSSDLAKWQQDARSYYDANMATLSSNRLMPVSSFTVNCTGTASTGKTIQLSVQSQLPLLMPVVLASSSGASGSSNMPTSLDVAARNTALYLPEGTLELVMVIDNADATGGAVNNASKMASLKDAAYTLINTIFLSPAIDARVGIVPFAATVNVKGALDPNGRWLSPVFQYNSKNVGMQTTNKQEGWGGCVVEPRDASDYLYPKAYSPKDTVKFTPYYYNVPKDGLRIKTYLLPPLCGKLVLFDTLTTSVPVTLQGGYVNQCGVGEAQGNGIAVTYDQLFGSTANAMTVGQNDGCIASPVTFLTTDKSVLSAAIDRMSLDGSSIIPVGLLWGWRMLSSAWAEVNTPNSGWISSDSSLPLPEQTAGLQRVMILLTDGENRAGQKYSIPNSLYFNGLSGVGTKSIAAPTIFRTNGVSLVDGTMDFSQVLPLPADGRGYSNDVNTFQLGVCSAIKESGVTIYSITFGNVSTAARDTMQGCATPGNYYEAPDGATLNRIFQQIVGNVGTLRLTQ
jgi:Flp pilus assembly protein TadG